MRTTRLLEDTNFGSLVGKNKYVLKYNATNNKFELANIDLKLIQSATDDDVADRFIEVIEPFIDVDVTEDYGTF
jgi:hypothetical protein